MSTAARFVTPLVVAVAAFGFVACGDTAPDPAAALFSDSTVTLDVAASSGDAIAKSVAGFSTNETTGGLSSADFAGQTASGPSMTPTNETRTRTCLDANNAVVVNCSPIASVRKIITQFALDASRSNTTTTTGGTSATWTGSVHRSAIDSITRVFTQTTETSRVHNGNALAHDTTTFNDATVNRKMVEVAHDSVKGVTFTVPRTANQYPSAGSIVRVDSVHVTVSKGELSITKDVVRTVSITFPADAQGNVVLKVNLKTCNLNLATGVVSACQ
jgi:hypothetical protein